jgi:hypothetical protein
MRTRRNGRAEWFCSNTPYYQKNIQTLFYLQDLVATSPIFRLKILRKCNIHLFFHTYEKKIIILLFGVFFNLTFITDTSFFVYFHNHYVIKLLNRIFLPRIFVGGNLINFRAHLISLELRYNFSGILVTISHFLRL